MKKSLIYSFIVLLSLLLFACGEQVNNRNQLDTVKQEVTIENIAEVAETKVVKIGVSISSLDDVFMGRYAYELVSYFDLKSDEENKYDINIEDAKNDKLEQTGQIDNFIASGVDILILDLVDTKSVTEVLDKCRAAHIPVVFINGEPLERAMKANNTGDFAGMYTYVGTDANQSGRFQGEIVAELPDKGDINADGTMKYMILNGSDNDADYKARSSIERYKEQSGCKVKCLEDRVGSWQKEKIEKIVSNALDRYGSQVEVIFCNNDEMALGARAAIEKKGIAINKDIYLVGMDGIKEAIDAISEGSMTGTVLNDINIQSHVAADIAIELFDGLAQDLYTWVDYIKITKDNANAYRSD